MKKFEKKWKILKNLYGRVPFRGKPRYFREKPFVTAYRGNGPVALPPTAVTPPGPYRRSTVRTVCTPAAIAVNEHLQERQPFQYTEFDHHQLMNPESMPVRTSASLPGMWRNAMDFGKYSRVGKPHIS